MSARVEDGAAKSKKNSVKVGGEFGGIAGFAVVGGVVAVGIAAGAIALLRNRHTKTNRNQLDKDENRHISSEKSAEICPSPKSNECFGGEEAKLIAPSSENGEETEPPVEIVESLSDLDVSPDWKDMNKSKEEGSPRSHFSRKTSIASTSSDSEDCSEVSKNNYTRDSEIDSSQMNLKEGDFYFVTAEETPGKESSSQFRECIPDKEVHNSSVEQSMDRKIEYEESVDSCDGLQGECEEVSSFVELGGSVAEQNRAGLEEERTDSEESDGCKDNKGHKGLDRSSKFEDSDNKGGVYHSDGIQHEESDDLEEDLYPISELCSREKNQSKELICPEADMQCHQNEQNKIVLDEHFVQEEEFESNVDLCLQERLKSEDSEDGMADKAHKVEQYVDEMVDSKGTTKHHDEIEMHRELEDSEDELKCTDVDFQVHHDRYKNEIVVTDEELLLCKEQCLQEENFESNVELCLQERLKAEDSGDGMADKAHKVEQYDDETVDSRHLDTTSNHDEIDRHRKLEDSEEERKYADVDLHVQQDGCKNEIVVADEELLLCNEQSLQEENFESNVEQCLQERLDSEEELENCAIDLANNGEQCHNEIVISKDFESSDYKETGSYWDEGGQNGEAQELEEHFGQIKEQIQQETVKEIECTEDNIHIHCNGQQNLVVDANEMVLPCKEQCPQEENFQYNVENQHQERTELQEIENFKLNEACNGKECHYNGIESNNFENLDHNECESYADEICRNKEKVVSKQYFSPQKEQFQEETVEDATQNEMVATYEQDVLSKEQSLIEGKFESHSENWQPEMTDSEELENSKVDVAHEGKQCHLEANDCTEFVALGKGVSYENGSSQYGEISSKDFEGCDEGKAEEQAESVSATSKEDLDIDIRSENNLHLEEENSEPSLETIEDISEMDTQCEESIIDSNEKEDSKGDALICKEEHQEETLDSIYSKTVFQDALVKNQESEELISKVDEQNLTEEVVPIIQEHSQKETADLIDKLDSVEDISLKSKQYEREMNESKVLDNPQISGDDMSDMDVQCEERTNDSNGKEDKGGDIVICKEDYQEESLDLIDSQTFVHDAHVENQVSEEVISKIEVLDSTEEVVPIIHEHSQKEAADSIGKLDSVEDLSLKSKQYEREMSESEVPDNSHISGDNMPDMDVQCEESTNDLNGKEDKGGDALICKEEYQEESLDLTDTQTVVHDAHVENEVSEEVISKIEELDSTEEVVPIIHEHSQKETADSIGKLDSVEDLSLKSKHYQSKMSDSEALDNLHISGEDMSDIDVQCEERNIDSNEKEVKEDNVLICKEECQKESLDSIETQNFFLDGHVKSQGSKEVISKFEEPDLTEEVVPIIQEHSPKETADSIDKLDPFEDLSLKNKQYQMKISESEVLDNLHISGEGMSGMDVQCEESTIDSNEKEDKEEGDLVCKEESLDSIDSQIFVQNAHVESQGIEEVICKFEEPDLTEEILPTSQEHLQEETADSIDKLDSVEDFSLKNKQYQGEVSESEVLDNLHISGEECKENTSDLEKLEQSENVCLSMEQRQQNIVDPKETIDLENVNQYKQCERTDVNGKEPDFSINNTLIPKGLCPNEIVDPKDLENEDLQTKPKEVDGNESEYSSGDAFCSEEKYQQETTDKAANEDYKQERSKSPEVEGVHTDNSEDSSTDTHCSDGQKELNQNTSTHIVSTRCILVGLSKETEVHKESTDNEADSVMKSESGAVANPISVTKRVKSGCDPLHPPQLDSTAEEAKFHSVQFPKNLTTRIRLFVCVFAFAAFFFLLASKLARISTSADAI